MHSACTVREISDALAMLRLVDESMYRLLFVWPVVQIYHTNPIRRSNLSGV